MLGFLKGDNVVLTHGFIKKGEKVPRLEIKKAEAYRKDFWGKGKANE